MSFTCALFNLYWAHLYSQELIDGARKRSRFLKSYPLFHLEVLYVVHRPCHVVSLGVMLGCTRATLFQKVRLLLSQSETLPRLLSTTKEFGRSATPVYNCCRTSAKNKYICAPSKKPSLTYAESGNDLTKLAGQGRDSGGGGGGGDNFGSPPPLRDDMVDVAMAGGTPLHTPSSTEETTDAEDDDRSTGP